jgi:DNA-binding beta-propeller fold protein YncE
MQTASRIALRAGPLTVALASGLATAAFAGPLAIDKIERADDGPFAGFGSCLSAEGGTLLAGAPIFVTASGARTGAAYLIDLATGDQRRLIPADARAWDDFGAAVDLEDGLAAVGAPLDNNDEFDSGSVSIFDATTGDLIRTITPNGPLNANFGDAVAVGGGKVAATSFHSGRRVWVYDLATGDLDFTIDTDSTGAPTFFTDIDIEDGRLFVAFTADIGTPQFGGVDAYDLATRDLVASYNAGNDPLAAYLGRSVAADGNTLAVGAAGDFIGLPGGDPNGSVYVFNIDDGLLRHRLTPGVTPGDAARFGLAVAVDGGTVHVGSEYEILPGVGHGAVYAFDADSGDLTRRLSSIEPGTPDDYTTIGASVAASDGKQFAGAVRWVANRSTEGLVYAVTTPCNGADLAEPFGVLDLADIQSFVGGFVAGDPIADLNDDGLFDLADVQALVGAFTAGCP